MVVDLHRQLSELDGDVSVSTVLEGGPRKLRTHLAARDSQSAIEAHDQKLPVMFRADIRKVGKHWRAESVREFRVLPKD